MKQRKSRRPKKSGTISLLSLQRRPVNSRKKSAKYYAKAKIRAARPVHKRIMLHPITVLFLLFVGVVFVGMTFKSSAVSYDVHGKVPAAPLTEGAVITSPANGARFSSAQQTVSGSCPDNSYVKLYVNNTFAGVAWCTTNTFQIQVSLYSGQNDLRAQDYNATDDPGPVTPIVTVTYTPPAPPPPPPSPPPNTVTGSTGTPIGLHGGGGSYSLHGNSGSGAPLLITSDFHYQTFVTGSTFSWQIDLEGGVAPYTVNINWGDSQYSTLYFKNDTRFWIEHTYTQAGYYPIVVKSVDANGTSRIVQLAALIKNAGAASIFSLFKPHGGQTSGTATGPWWRMWLWVAWPLWLVLILMAFSFWLGEREVYAKLKRQAGATRRYAHR